MSRRARAGTDSTAAEGRTPGRHDRSGDPPALPSLGLREADCQELQAGIALARQQLETIAISDACKDILKPSPVERSINKMFEAENRIRNLISPDLERLQQVNAGIRPMRVMNPILEAERERWQHLEQITNPSRGMLEGLRRTQTIGLDQVAEAERERRQWLAEITNPCRGLQESFRMQTSGLERVAAANTAWVSGMVEASASLISSRHISLGLDATSALRNFGPNSIDGLHVPVRIHAVPRLPAQRTSRPGRCRESFLDRLPLSPVPEVPSYPEPTGWLEDGLDDEGGRRVLGQLSRFVRSEEIPSDAREGMDFLLALWKLKKTGLSKTEKHRLQLTVVDFLRQQIGVLPPAGGLQQLTSGLLVPHPHGKTPVPNLAPEIFTTQQLAKKLHSTTDTLKRHAKKACENGPLPQPMPAFPGWFVVSQSAPKGGQGCGWKFQQRSELQDN